jgi:cystathionine beta-lyase
MAQEVAGAPRFDFTTRVERLAVGSNKWNRMHELKPEVDPLTVPLSLADMEFVTAPAIVSALAEYAQTHVLGYTSPTDDYYDAVLGWQFRRHAWTPSLNWLVLSPGVVPALYNAVKAFTSVGDGVIIQPPVYYPFRWAIESAGRHVTKNRLKLVDGRYEIDFEDLERKAKDPANKVMFICNPHNPVGRVWTREELRRIAEICLAHDVFMVSDEIHNDLIMPGYTHTTLMKVLAPAEFNSCMVCTAPTKTFNLAGTQVSNIFIASKYHRERFVEEFGKSAIHGVNCFAFPATVAAYEESEDWLEALLEVIVENKRVLDDFLAAEFPEVHSFDLEGTYLAWLDLRELAPGHKELEEINLKHDLFFDEGYIFGKLGRGFERINLACPTSVIEDMLPRLRDALTECKAARV